MAGGRVQVSQEELFQPTSAQDLRYGYDGVGNVLSIRDYKVSPMQTQSFAYDALDRILSAVADQGVPQGGYEEEYSYDGIGNLASKGGVSYEYDDPAHVHAVTHLGGVRKYWYDGNGNMTQRLVGSDTYQLGWDAENRLVEVQKNGSVVATFTYDGDGRRVKGTVEGVTSVYVGDHYEQIGSTVRKYYYLGGQRVAMRDKPPGQNNVYWLLGDHLGSTAVTANSSGSKVAELRYKAYGEVRYSSGTTPTSFRFTGQRLDGYINLYIMGARWYDPTLGRWISPDPVCPTSSDYSQFSLVLTVSYAEASFLTQLNAANRQGGMSSEAAGLLAPENPQLCNRFSYVANNPLGFTDPSGHDPIPPWRRWAGKVCGALAATFDTLAWVVSGASVVLEGAGLVGVPITVGEEPLTFLGAALLYNIAFNPIENVLSYGSFGFTATGDWLSGASYIKLDPLTVGMGQDTAVSYAAIVVGSGLPLTPEAFTDFLLNSAVLYYDYGRLLEQIPTGLEIQVIGVTEDGLDILAIVPIVDE